MESCPECIAAAEGTYTDVDAWRDNYYGMAARWAACDAERLALKDALADAEMKLRILSSRGAP